jgi:hypothetical protein
MFLVFCAPEGGCIPNEEAPDRSGFVGIGVFGVPVLGRVTRMELEMSYRFCFLIGNRCDHRVFGESISDA